jgi:hypothetical protein
MSASHQSLRSSRTLPFASATTLVSCLLWVIGATAANAALIRKCPSPQALEAAAGTPLTIGTHKAGMDVFCYYTHPLATPLQDYVNIGVEPLGESSAAFERSAEAFARALKVPFKRLAGIGAEAWEYTERRTKLDDGGRPTTTVTIVIGTREVTVISNLAAQKVLALAEQVS